MTDLLRVSSVVAGIAVLGLGTAARPAAAEPPAECVVLGAAGAGATISNATECRRATAPASTFKIPHALIALDAGVITADTEMAWDGAPHDSPYWRRPHTVVSAIQWSALPFFRHTARLIGRDRMRDGLAALGYANDTFEGALTEFWLNGDLAVTPVEQYEFLQRFVAGRLPIASAHLDTVRKALTMPAGQVTNASGAHPFTLAWQGPIAVRVKTGNTLVAGERVSWAVGSVTTGDREIVIVARVRATGDLAGTAGLELARRALNAAGPRGRAR